MTLLNENLTQKRIIFFRQVQLMCTISHYTLCWSVHIKAAYFPHSRSADVFLDAQFIT